MNKQNDTEIKTKQKQNHFKIDIHTTIAIDQTIDIIALVAVVVIDTGRMIDMVACFRQRDAFHPVTHPPDIPWIIALVVAVVTWEAVIIRRIGIQTKDPIVTPNPMAAITERP